MAIDGEKFDKLIEKMGADEESVGYEKNDVDRFAYALQNVEKYTKNVNDIVGKAVADDKITKAEAAKVYRYLLSELAYISKNARLELNNGLTLVKGSRGPLKAKAADAPRGPVKAKVYDLRDMR